MGEPLDIIYFRFPKAFVIDPHNLQKYGLRWPVLKWLEDFLLNRCQIESIKEQLSKMSEATSGVPQDSVLGPELFLLYISNLPDGLQSYCQILAHDTKMYRKVRSVEDALVLLQDTQRLET